MGRSVQNLAILTEAGIPEVVFWMLSSAGFFLPFHQKISTPKGNRYPAACGLEVLFVGLFDNSEVKGDTGGRGLEFVD